MAEVIMNKSNQKNLILLALVSCFSLINALEDYDVRSWNKDLLVNRIGKDGNAMAHRVALDCQRTGQDGLWLGDDFRYLEASEEERSKGPFTDLFLQNPFIKNEDGRTPRQIAQGIFETTGSLNCLRKANSYKAKEKLLIRKLIEEQRSAEELAEQDDQVKS